MTDPMIDPAKGKPRPYGVMAGLGYPIALAWFAVWFSLLTSSDAALWRTWSTFATAIGFLIYAIVNTVKAVRTPPSGG
ncbi:hypothetical protein WDJ51_08835 [Rathayibacter sp. YIM 133350]|uniref:hypothetical protein n=1 Tax=Rathayibacter sp. YIM 133350 TaxID=3131992 RepID=UPI00307F31B6